MSLWSKFTERFPNANLSKFIESYDNVQYQMGNGNSKDVFDSHGNFHPSLYFSKQMKVDLGIAGFPLELTLNCIPDLSIPAVQFSVSPHPLGDKLVTHQVYVTPSDKFTIKFRDIFSNNIIRHESGSESKKWLSGPNMNYWPQQLNFALWCATTGCGISIRSLYSDGLTDSELKVPPQVRSFLWLHVYFTVRRILFEMGGIQAPVALPGDPVFEMTNNKYDKPSYERS